MNEQDIINDFGQWFGLMVKIVLKAASRESDIPVNPLIINSVIDATFTNPEKVRYVINLFKKNRDDYNLHHKNEKLSFDDVLDEQDRKLFLELDFLPDFFKTTYGDYTKWFAEYLAYKMPEEEIDVIWRYIIYLNNII